MEKRKNFTSKIKAEIVLSLLRGEDPELLSREYGVTLADINLWRDQFIESGTDGFKRKPDDSRLGICGRILSEDDVRMILASGKSSLIRGMTSRKNKKFDAFIVLKEDGSTAFEFPSTFRPAKKRGKHGEK